MSFLNLLQSELDASTDTTLATTTTNHLTVSIGSTPSLSHHVRGDDASSSLLENVVELHPGNYTLYDRQQLWTGACHDPSLVAGRVLTTVIGHYEDRNMIMLDAGATALTKDTSPQGGMCEVTGFPELECHRMSQEVTLVRPKDSNNAICPFDRLPIGSKVTLLPNHSCLSAACFDKYHIIDDPTCMFAIEETVVDVWTPAKYFALPDDVSETPSLG
jgi:D-serine ammonia-lyase